MQEERQYIALAERHRQIRTTIDELMLASEANPVRVSHPQVVI